MKNTLLFNVANSKGQDKAEKPDLKNSFFQPKNIVEINEGNYFIDFGNAFFGTVQIRAKQSQRDSLIIHFWEELASPNKIGRNPGATIRYRKPKLKNLDATPPLLM
ncbi:family 78 glycoside hydrolase catalytic domain [Maribacter sp. ANRC-HE7]|uniref:Family 78 glycoside hydrolase catalytic domain n=1 Tax=Maribacter aquimaris TaxID=2737171 RepID=A0ABR7UZ09_9FLAO|nr:family 78 glycoside hydrolase catalytic domain [Maribacter aquimaris]MBD0777778.1 family 78 glycoside hydrolase catalytic domain [Maribacter aquimaris]